jgi:hypothetical protein
MSLHEEKDNENQNSMRMLIQSDDPAAQPVQPKENDTDDDRPEEEFNGINNAAKKIIA